ncbi:DUF1998 domain-containing protein [Acinetobacter sp. YH18001]|nr:DUF1998 domain-containing protein [Acinetobacter sp. YH18001]
MYQPISAALRQATNIYFSKVSSSIQITTVGNNVDSDIEEKFENLQPDLKEIIESSGEIDQKVAYMFMATHGIYSKDELFNFFNNQSKDTDITAVPDSELEYKFQEYQQLIKECKNGPLITKTLQMENFESWFRDFFSGVTQVKELTITNAFYGFDRIEPQTNRTIESYKKILREDNSRDSNWLPAVQVHGEGIFLQFNMESIKQWASIFEKREAFRNLVEKANKIALVQNIGDIGPAFLLAHTFSHLLINQLIFDCGYSTASLRERLYVSNNPEIEMCGLLIYTAAGDSEGSLGGLVRMAEPETLQLVIKKAIESSNWCSSDPICREIGDNGGQGPRGMNLAACHNCALLPETSCEVFNSLLDRGAVISRELNDIGYFDKLFTASKIS